MQTVLLLRSRAPERGTSEYGDTVTDIADGNSVNRRWIQSATFFCVRGRFRRLLSFSRSCFRKCLTVGNLPDSDRYGMLINLYP